MPYATNRTDGVRTYFEDDGGDGPPILFYAGLGDPLEYSRANRLTDALRPEYRLIFADHRGHGRSDKPHDEASYDLRTRVGDVLAVLDTVGIERTHFFGFSWGASFDERLDEPIRSWTLDNDPKAVAAQSDEVNAVAAVGPVANCVFEEGDQAALGAR